jgi:hypothetical protein
MPVGNNSVLATREVDAAISRDLAVMTKGQRQKEAAKLTGKNGQRGGGPKVTNPRAERSKAKAPSSLRTEQSFTSAARTQTSTHVKALLHQTMEPVSAHLARIPVVGFMPTVGTALARTVDTYSRDYSDYLNVVPSSDSHQTDRNGKFAMQNDLSVEPIILLREPLVSHIQRTIVPPGSTPRYSIDTAFLGLTATALVAGDALQLNGQFIGHASVTTQIPVTSMTHQTGFACYGNTAPAGRAGGRNVVWLDTPGEALTATTITAAFTTVKSGIGEQPVLPSNGPEFVVSRHVSETRFEPAGSAEMTKGETDASRYECTFSLVGSGYYSFSLVFPGSFGLFEGTNFSYVFEGFEMTYEFTGSTAFQHVMPLALEGKEDIIRQARVNGSSLFVQNTSAEQARGGTVYATQLAGDVPWYESIADVRNISNNNSITRYVGDWAKGFYGYAKPQGSSPMDLLDVWSDLDDPVQHLHVPLFEPFRNIGTVVVLIQAPTPLAGTFSPTQYTMHVVRAYEFTTVDQFFDVEPPMIPPQHYDEYVTELSRMPQFFENPLHLAAIAALIARAAMMVQRYGPSAMHLAKAFLVAKDLARSRR